MPYLVRAEVEKPGSGTFTASANNKRDAVEKAQGLRSEGLRVQITDPEGRPVDEGENDGAGVKKNPTCPNCGQPMTFIREGQSSALCVDPHVFECTRCLIVLMTEDHETLAGHAVQ